MENLSLHILDVAENSVRAGATTISISIEMDVHQKCLTIRIHDDGKGMDPDEVKNALNPFYTTKAGKRFGLGLNLFAQASEETGGSLTVRSEKGVGTEVEAIFMTEHPDMKPLGEIIETLATLIGGRPELRLLYNYDDGVTKEHFDSGNFEADN